MKNKTLIALILSISFVIVLSACGKVTTNTADTTANPTDTAAATAAQTIVIDQPWLSETPEQVYVNNGTLGIDLPPGEFIQILNQTFGLSSRYNCLRFPPHGSIDYEIDI